MTDKSRAELIAELRSQPKPEVSDTRTPEERSAEIREMADTLAPLREQIDDGERWQYALVNVGMFQSRERMAATLDAAGANGWELVTVYDKASNWLSGSSPAAAF